MANLRRRGRRASRARSAWAPTFLFLALAAVCGLGGAGVAASLIATPRVVEVGVVGANPEGDSPAVPAVDVVPAPSEPAPVSASPADTPCASAVTMSVWAHYDDDLIFFNPVLQDAMNAGDCIRTVFLTASDAGRGIDYSQKRELGILRAYNVMRGQSGFWSETRVTLLSGAVLSQWSPQGDPDITVAFLRLPDGNLTGGGFSATGSVALPLLLGGSIGSMTPITGGPALSSEAVVATLAELITAYHPTRLTTHVPAASPESAGDHPDHSAAGAFARAAWQRAGLPVDRVGYAVGYPSEMLPVNVTGEQLTRKLGAYRSYAEQDSVVTCATDAACLSKPRFGDWLQRNYVRTDAELFPLG